MVKAPEPLDFSQTAVDSIPPDGVAAIAEILRSGNLFRYGETGGIDSNVAKLEQQFAQMHGKRYAIAVNSGGCAIFLSLVAAGVTPGETVMMNAFTLAPVPGAIEHCGAEVILLDAGDDLAIDLESLQHAVKTTGSRVLLLSYMRGHIPDMDEILKIVEDNNLVLIEDCAHVLGAKWRGHAMGTLGRVSCFSLQTYKQVNGGEGGMILTDDADIAARAILMSGSYMLYGQHLAGPDEEVFSKWAAITPNYSMRLNEMSAAAVLSQLPILQQRIEKWNSIHDRIAGGISSIEGLEVPNVSRMIQPAPTSIQFIAQHTISEITSAISTANSLGLELKWFGDETAKGFTSHHGHWSYLPRQTLESTDSLMKKLLDIRLPSTLSDEECDALLEILKYAFSGD
jgi:dTDP-4-amino-4,6-dideoxygalactose transaminase